MVISIIVELGANLPAPHGLQSTPRLRCPPPFGVQISTLHPVTTENRVEAQLTNYLFLNKGFQVTASYGYLLCIFVSQIYHKTNVFLFSTYYDGGLIRGFRNA